MSKAAARTWKKFSGVSAWSDAEGRVIVKQARRRLGRNGWRKAGYELFSSANGHSLGFYLTLADAKASTDVHFYNFDQCRTVCGVSDLDVTTGRLEMEDITLVTCPACSAALADQ